MSLPPLPETFGNYALHEFSEVASPDAISWLPQSCRLDRGGSSAADIIATLQLEAPASLAPQSLPPRGGRPTPGFCDEYLRRNLADRAE